MNGRPIAGAISGPPLGLRKPEWQADAGTIGTHTLAHRAFGIATAAGAKAPAEARSFQNIVADPPTDPRPIALSIKDFPC